MLALRPGQRVVDATINGAGHAEAMLHAVLPGGALLGLDADPAAVVRAKERLAFAGDAARVVHSNFRGLPEVLTREEFASIDACLFDLGLSSYQLDALERGFSFRSEAPLDFRFDPTSGQTAGELIDETSDESLAAILYSMGEEPRGRAIAKELRARRRAGELTTAKDLAHHTSKVARFRRPGLHPATRTFQALRMAVNDELGALATSLPAAWSALRPGGRLAVISFHSLEDRIVKQFFRAEKGAGRANLLTPKPVQASREEVRRNPRSRSAKLRVAERMG